MRSISARRYLALLVALAVVACSSLFMTSGAPGAWFEASSDDYTHSDPESTSAIFDESSFLSMDQFGSYYLECDIVLYSSWNISGKAFAGELDGRGCTVTLLGNPMFTDFSGILKNIKIEGYVGSIDSPYHKDAGAVALNVTGEASFCNVRSDSDVFAASSAGGLIGSVSGGDSSKVIFEDCFVMQDVWSGAKHAGGIAGYCESGIVEFMNCSFSGAVSGQEGAGGICGYAASAGILAFSCSNTGSVASISGFAGGIIGGGEDNYIYIKNGKNGSDHSSPAGESGKIQSGGPFAAGILAHQAGGYSFIENCKNYAGISTQSEYVGGIAGYLCGAVLISNCHNYGEINSAHIGGHAAGIVALAANNQNLEDARRVEYCSNSGNISGTGMAGGIAGIIADGLGSALCGNINNGDIHSPGGFSGGVCASAYGSQLSLTYNCNSGNITADTGTASQIITCYAPLTELSNNFCISSGTRAAAYMNLTNEWTSLEPDFTFEPSELADGRLASRLNSLAAGGSGHSDDRAGSMAACYGILFQKLGVDSHPSTDRSRGVVYYANQSLTNIAEAGFEPDLIVGGENEYLAAVRTINSVARFNGKLILTADLNLTLLEPELITNFWGIFEGRGHLIITAAPLIGQLGGRVSELSIAGSVSAAEGFEASGALAASISGFAQISCVRCEADVGAGSSSEGGGLVGSVDAGYAAFLNCSFGGTVTAAKAAGGIAGICRRAILSFEGCENTGSISGGQAGGILGVLGSSKETDTRSYIAYCYNNGEINATNPAGGLIGQCYGRLSVYCSGNYGSVTATSSIAGGVVGYALPSGSVDIAFCFNTGDVTARTYASGVLGYCNTEEVSVVGCYACGKKPICTSGKDNSCAIIYNRKSSNNGISKNFYLEDCFKYPAYQLDKEIDVGCAFSSFCLESGELAYRINDTAGREVFFQTLGTSAADPYPTTDRSRGSVLVISQTASGSLGFGNSIIEPTMLTGASVRLSEHSGIRFTAHIPEASAAEASRLSDPGSAPIYGTLIFPTDYINKYGIASLSIAGLAAAGIDEYNFATPEANNNPRGSYYINLRAEKGMIPDAEGGIYINAALVELEPSAYTSRFSAISYIAYLSGGEWHYVYSNYDPMQNSRSIAYVASQALADTKPYRDVGNGYIYRLDDGSFSQYSPEGREFLGGYLQNHN